MYQLCRSANNVSIKKNSVVLNSFECKIGCCKQKNEIVNKFLTKNRFYIAFFDILC